VPDTVSEQANVGEIPIASDGQICSLRYIAALRKANFPADDLEAATRDLERMFETYSTTQPAPRNSKFAAELESLNNLAGKLARAVKGLSGRARQEFGYEALKLTKPLWAFYARTNLTLKNTPPDMGGPKMQLKERNLVFQVAILWRRNFPTGKAVTRTSAGEYRGPLLDFVENVLKLEGVRIQSSNALGKQLYEMRTTGGNDTFGPPCSLIDENARQAKSRN
jgi:hypothetical protein